MGGIKGRGAAKERRREASKVAATGGGVARGGDRHGGVVEEGQQGPGAIAGQRSATLACLRTTALRRGQHMGFLQVLLPREDLIGLTDFSPQEEKRKLKTENRIQTQ
uniref:Uncharacterized protein n=1 Tax=Mus spicilegus TaxID=10103 RepID=A0A8C6I985_MUSSI